MRMALILLVAAIGLPPQVQDPPPAPAGPKIQIKFEEGGLVSLLVQGATVREVLAEWSRQGGSTFVNSERLGGAPLTLEYVRQPEKDVMASLLRQAAGFLLGPRRAGSVGASSFEVVYILPTSNPSASTSFSAPVTTYQPQLPTSGNPDDELPPVGRGVPPPGAPTPTPTPTPDYGRPAGSSPVAVAVVPVTAGAPTPTPTPSPTPTPPPPPPGGRSGAAGS
jgi:hypothetical protein